MVRANVIGGGEQEINVERAADGSIQFVDATGQGAERASKRNLSTVHEGAGIAVSASQPQPGLDDLPGPVLSVPAGQTPDRDALTAGWAARSVLDFYKTEHGRDSFDGEGSPLPSTVHVPQPGQGQCATNGAFLTVEGHSQMLYGVPCVARDGSPIVATWIDLAVAGHEVQHGVTHTNARNIGDTVQSGAVDEGTSDYFGVVIQNRVLGIESSTNGVFVCQGVQSRACREQPDGRAGVRTVASGATFDDYEFVLTEPFGLAGQIVDALHQNALVYTNALWQIRTRLAQIDGTDANKSERVRRFDRIVYRATTRYFTDGTDFLAAAEAIQRAANEVGGVTAEEREIIRRQFVVSKICRGCQLPPVTGRPVAVSSSNKVRPQVVEGGVAYNEFTTRIVSRPQVARLAGGGTPSPIGDDGVLTLHMRAAGTSVVALSVNVQSDRASLVLLDTRGGQRRELTRQPFPFAPPAIDGTGVAYVELLSQRSAQIVYEPIGGGARKTLAAPGQPAHIAVDGTNVAIQLADGTLAVWDTNTTSVRPLPPVEPAPAIPGVLIRPGGLALSGNRLASISFANDPDQWNLVVFDIDTGAGTVISDKASPFGIDLEGDLLVWADTAGIAEGRVARLSGSVVADTDIEAFSFRTGTFYRILPGRGQQGFPEMDGNRIVYQDSAGGSNDVYTIVVPSSL